MFQETTTGFTTIGDKYSRFDYSVIGVYYESNWMSFDGDGVSDTIIGSTEIGYGYINNKSSVVDCLLDTSVTSIG